MELTANVKHNEAVALSFRFYLVGVVAAIMITIARCVTQLMLSLRGSQVMEIIIA